MKIAVVLVAAALLSGCTTWDLGHRWTKPGIAPQQLTLDDVECRRVAAKAGNTPESFVGGVVDVRRVVTEETQRINAYDHCMTGRGYARVRETTQS